MAYPTQKECRQALAGILAAALQGSAGIVKPFRTGYFEQQSPIVIVTSEAMGISKEIRGVYFAQYAFMIVILARYEGEEEEEAAEDTLDDIGDVVVAELGKTENQVTELWAGLDLVNDVRDSIELGGASFRRSMFVARPEIFNR